MHARPRKALFSSNSDWSVYNFRIGLIRALQARGFATVSLSPGDRWSERLAQAGCEVRDIAIDSKGVNPLRDGLTLLRFRKEMKALRPDLALLYTIKPVIYGTLAARSLGIPAICTIPGLGTAFIRRNWLTRVVELLYRIALRWPSGVFFLNADDHQLFLERGLVGKEKALLIPGEGIDLERYPAEPYPGNESPVFLFIGRVLRDKGIGELVAAARRVKARHPAVRFQVLGPVDEPSPTALRADEVDAWVKEGVVEYLGETMDVQPYIAKADCVVLPSYREGTSRTLLEGAAMARPLVATDVPGCREVIDDGVNGLLCRVRDAADLEAKLEAMIARPAGARAEMGRAGRRKVEREFDQENVLAVYIREIEKALK
jgi:glycosyltransferase involved in cell wall biosynthesis